MSLHPSLRSASKIKIKKTVQKRFDRIEMLKKRGKWKDGDSVYGLPKTKAEE